MAHQSLSEETYWSLEPDQPFDLERHEVEVGFFFFSSFVGFPL